MVHFIKFVDTSGSFNLLTPSSAKDFPREFLTRIHERCQIQQQQPLKSTKSPASGRSHNYVQQQYQQQTTIVLDPQSGKVSTVLEKVGVTSPVEQQQTVKTTSTAPIVVVVESSQPVVQPPPDGEATKKPSYLNLACCVNGYSNLTTYDSKLRQNINKSREVSPIRPITTTTATSQQPSSSASLQVPIYYTAAVAMDHRQNQHRTVLMSPEKRLFTAHLLQSPVTNGVIVGSVAANNSVDATDNVVNGNGGDHFRTTTKYRQTSYSSKIAATTTTTTTTANGNGITTTTMVGNEAATPPYKSFIEQKVERLYGPGALAQGFHINRRSMEKQVLAEKQMNSQNIYSNSVIVTTTTPGKPIRNGAGADITSRKISGDFANGGQGGGEQKNLKDLDEALPVFRHLRPEFRAQLPISSPKRSPPQVKAAANGAGTKTTNNDDEDEAVLVDTAPLQFQTVSISKLSVEKSPMAIGGGPVGAEDTIYNINNNTNSVAKIKTKPEELNNTITNRASNNSSNSNGIENDKSNIQQKEVLLLSAEKGTTTTHVKPSQEIIVTTEIAAAANNITTIADKENGLPPGANGSEAEEEEAVSRNGTYFLIVMNNERQRIVGRADICDGYMAQLEVF